MTETASAATCAACSICTNHAESTLSWEVTQGCHPEFWWVLVKEGSNRGCYGNYLEKSS